MEYVRGYARRRKTRTSSEYVRQENAYVTGTRSHNIRTSSDRVRQANTYDGGRRTSTNHVHQYNVSESRSSRESVREENAYVTENTYVSGRRTSAEYVRSSQHRRICTHGCRSPRMRTPNLYHHGRSWNTMYSLRRQTDLERSRMPLITVPVRNVRRFDLDTLR